MFNSERGKAVIDWKAKIDANLKVELAHGFGHVYLTDSLIDLSMHTHIHTHNTDITLQVHRTTQTNTVDNVK